MAYPFTSKQNIYDQESITVYPEVYESRQENSEKILVIGGYSLNLQKASVLADTVLLLEVTENGTIEEYVQGSHYERHLFEDTDKMASLILNPVGKGDYHITGMMKSKPILEMSPRNPEIESRTLPSSYTVETHFIPGINHTAYFGNETEDRVAYAMLFMHSVSLRLQQLEPPARIGLTAIEGLKVTQPYLNIHTDGQVMADQTLNALGSYAHRSEVHKKSDVVYMAVSVGLVKIRNGEKRRSYLWDGEGIGKACRNGRAGIGLDRPVTFSGVQTAAHEIAHLLNAPHDGTEGAVDCPGSDGYIMSSPRRNGNNSCAFSSCSKKIIAYFIKWPYSKCLWRNDACDIISLPNKAANLPGDVMDGSTFCKEYYRPPRYVKSIHLKIDSELEQCVFRCLVEYSKPKGKMENRTSFAINGTLCSESEPLKICRNMVCAEP
ncbi:hypothetical protein MTO96_016385 [Rhipicephalus appendiculatus]